MSLKEAREKIVHLRNEMRNESVRTEWINGYIDGLGEALYAIDDSSIDEVPNRMTLEELAQDLRKIFKFKYLTLEHTGYISLWKNRPKYSEDFTGSGKTWRRGDDHICGLCAYLFPNSIDVELDLEEYKDAEGNIDYSKCIVEVKE